MLNILLTAGSFCLLGVQRMYPSRIVTLSWVVSCVLFAISYGFLLVRVLATPPRVQTWVAVWTMISGVFAFMVLVGSIYLVLPFVIIFIVSIMNILDSVVS